MLAIYINNDFQIMKSITSYLIKILVRKYYNFYKKIKHKISTYINKRIYYS